MTLGNNWEQNLIQEDMAIAPSSLRTKFSLLEAIKPKKQRNGVRQLACNYFPITNSPTLNIIQNFILFPQITVNNSLPESFP